VYDEGWNDDAMKQEEVERFEVKVRESRVECEFA